MSKLRRSGSCEVLRLPKDIDLTAVDFAGHRFRTIDTAASEEVSVGWVTPADPTGNQHSADEMDLAETQWLRFRVDAKKFPASRLRLELEAQEHARGKPLRARERRELRDHLHEQLLPGIQPSSKMVDLLIAGDRCLLLSGSKRDRETLQKLLHESAGVTAQHLTAGELAARFVAEAALAKLSPIALPGQTALHQTTFAHLHDWLGNEFLLWLWWRADEDASLGDFGIMLEDLVEFGQPDADATTHVLRKGVPQRTAEAKAALRSGRLPTRLRLTIADESHSATLTLTGQTLGMACVSLPQDSDGCETSEDRNLERGRNWRWLAEAVSVLFGNFINHRVMAAWADEFVPQINAWRQQ